MIIALPIFIILFGFFVAFILFTFIALMAVHKRMQTQITHHNVKIKRVHNADEKTQLLMELLDDDELYAFKQTLKERSSKRHNQLSSYLVDGELPFDAEEYEYFNRS